jgi:hypothetical protein
MTLQAIGDGLGISRERVRQVQETALVRKRGRNVPPSASHHVGQMIAAVLREAGDADTGLAGGLLALAEVAFPGRAGGARCADAVPNWLGTADSPPCTSALKWPRSRWLAGPTWPARPGTRGLPAGG